MYSNPKIPEGINTSKEHPLKEFSFLLVGALILIVGATIVLGLFGGWAAGKIPFSAEVKIANLYEMATEEDASSDSLPPSSPSSEKDSATNTSDNKKELTNQQEIQRYLQNLANKIQKTQQLPKEMKITVHYLTSDTLNAFATLGGHVILYKGLLKKLPSENALVMLLSHEIAHIKYRHPIKSLGRGIAASIAISAIAGSADSNALGEAGLLTTLHYTREMEKQSDEEAMHTLSSIYGHIGGGADLFKEFQRMRDQKDSGEPPALFSSHPLDQDRIDNFATMAKKNNWQAEGKLTPLPPIFKTFKILKTPLTQQ